MPTTHLTCLNCEGQFDYVLSAESYLVHTPGNTQIITSQGQTLRTTSIKLFNKHRIKCPYCGEKVWYKVNL